MDYLLVGRCIEGMLTCRRSDQIATGMLEMEWQRYHHTKRISTTSHHCSAVSQTGEESFQKVAEKVYIMGGGHDAEKVAKPLILISPFH